jgi:hypothetical protein
LSNSGIHDYHETCFIISIRSRNWGTFHNCKKATILRTTLQEMGYQQPATPIQTDNSTACEIANNSIKQQPSRAIDMQYYWVRDWQQQGHFNIFWAPGTDNLADYFTKHFSARHHQDMRQTYVHSPQHVTNTQAIANALLVLQGCVKPAPGEAQAIPNDKVYSQDERTIAQAIYISNMKSDDIQTVKTTTRLAIG